jgi:hypothetical protein
MKNDKAGGRVVLFRMLSKHSREKTDNSSSNFAHSFGKERWTSTVGIKAY